MSKMRGTPSAMTHGLYARSPSALEIRGRKVARLMRRLRVVAPWLEPRTTDGTHLLQLEILSRRHRPEPAQRRARRDEADHRRRRPRGLAALVGAHRRDEAGAVGVCARLGLTPLARSR